MKKVLTWLSALGLIVLFVFIVTTPVNTPTAKSVTRTAQNPSKVQEVVNASDTDVKYLDLSKGSVVTLYTDVNPMSTNKVINGIRAANRAHPDRPIYLLLNSPGGSVLDGARIISAMQASKAPVSTVCLEMCASMAAMILEYGEQRYAVDRSTVMFHPASINMMFQGEIDKITSRMSYLKRYIDKMDHETAKRSSQTYESFKAQSSRELWLDAEDALAGKYIDNIVSLDISTEYNNPAGESNSLDKDYNVDFVWK